LNALILFSYNATVRADTISNWPEVSL